MKLFISTLGVIIFVISMLIFFINFANAQAEAEVRIIVLSQHETNFNKLIPWLEENHLFKDKIDFINSIKETFKFAKKGDIGEYRYL
ncbi:hypothetical protein [Candidatus Kryptobacter tengchongensis]|uniref:Uncharacterized protein n=1 Tax=Kryptobacter tengchongensis TaxID=1643429 RepID=A0A916LIP6_KRYT1|nr:hypothetical protein [Candidatus Kryptobacter tengchongensis]CUS98626.1 hypothetical protein JGI25_00448 [Candidatus Kryptobacter tengchongensis]